MLLFGKIEPLLLFKCVPPPKYSFTIFCAAGGKKMIEYGVRELLYFRMKVFGMQKTTLVSSPGSAESKRYILSLLLWLRHISTIYGFSFLNC